MANKKEISGKDPYAEGKHIKNPEPNNGKVEKKAKKKTAPKKKAK